MITALMVEAAAVSDLATKQLKTPPYAPARGIRPLSPHVLQIEDRAR